MLLFINTHEETDMNNDTKHTNAPEQQEHTPAITLTTPEAAQYLRLSVATLNKWRVYGGGPPFVKLGRAVRYRLNDVEDFMSARRRSSTSNQ